MDVANHLTERFTWESPHGTMVSRECEFQVEGERTWYTFIKHVRNREKEVEWVDGVCDSGFKSVRPEKVVRIRGIKPKPRPTQPGNAKSVDSAKTS